MRQVPLVLGCALALAACGADDGAESETAVSRNYDALAEAVANCAGALHSCQAKGGAGSGGISETCRTQFLDCRKTAGKDSEDRLGAAIDACQERRDDCRDSADDSAARDKCAETLRACIGDAPPRGNIATRVSGPNADAPTYQCFGQLRECVIDGESPSKCVTAARTCVITAVGDLPRPPSSTPSTSDEDAGTSSGSGAAGHAGAAGSKPSDAPRAGAGGSTPAADADVCAKQQMACVMSGEKPQQCAQKQRMCEKDL